MTTAAQHIAPKTFDSALIQRVGPIGKVLSEFLDSERSNIQRELTAEFPKAPGNAVDLLLNAFVTVDGTKKPLKLEEISIQGISKEQLLFCLNRLERGRILRLDDDTYELAHDTLAGHIHSQRSAEEIGLLEAAGVVKNRWKDFEKTETLMNAKEVDLVAIYVDTLEERAILSPDELDFVRRSAADVRRKRLARRVTVGAIMLILAVSTIYAFSQERIARDAQSELQNTLDIVEEQYAEILKSNKRADESNYAKLLTSGIALMELNPPDYEAAYELFAQARLIADRYVNNDSLSIELESADGRDAYALAEFANEQKELKPMFDSLMERGLRTENIGFEHYLTALNYYTSALNLNYNNKRAETSIELLKARLPIAFESLRKDGDVYFDVGETVGDPTGYRNALARYRQAAAISAPQMDREHIENRIRLCESKLGNLN